MFTRTLAALVSFTLASPALAGTRDAPDFDAQLLSEDVGGATAYQLTASHSGGRDPADDSSVLLELGVEVGIDPSLPLREAWAAPIEQLAASALGPVAPLFEALSELTASLEQTAAELSAAMEQGPESAEDELEPGFVDLLFVPPADGHSDLDADAWLDLVAVDYAGDLLLADGWSEPDQVVQLYLSAEDSVMLVVVESTTTEARRAR